VADELIRDAYHQKTVADVENNEERCELEVSPSERAEREQLEELADCFLKARAIVSGFNDSNLKATAMIWSDCLICAKSARYRYLSKQWIGTEGGRRDSGDDTTVLMTLT
jgi:hypothetical protein